MIRLAFSFLFILLLLVLINSGCSNVVVSSRRDWSFTSNQNVNQAQLVEEKGNVIELEPLIASLSDQKKNRFCRLKISLELKDGFNSDDLDKPLLFSLRNKFTNLLALKKSEILKTAEGKATLQREFRKSVQQEDVNELIENVYITDLIIGE